MFGLGETETLVILLAILLLFGANRIPDIAKSMGSGIREFRRAMREVRDEVNAAALDPTPAARSTAPAQQAPALAPPALPAPESSIARPASTPAAIEPGPRPPDSGSS